jgi:FG-GAP repeat
MFSTWRQAALSISSVALAAAIAFDAHAAPMQFTQQGSKLVGTGYASTSPKQGTSVAISGDGNTVIVGGPGDADPSTGAQVGAAWVFTRNNDVWKQQGAKLVGTGAPGDANQGTSVALSADGNTAIIGGPADNATTGAAWVFTRTNGVWSQQGAKLVATDAIGLAQQGQSVSLSADGNTAIVGGPGDNSNVGAAWIFTRSSGVWSQTSKVLCFCSDLNAVALSGDASTALIGNIVFVNRKLARAAPELGAAKQTSL